jgi:hypothetical protein
MELDMHRLVSLFLLVVLYKRGLVSLHRGLLRPRISCWGGVCEVEGFRLSKNDAWLGTPLGVYDLALLLGWFRPVALLCAPLYIKTPAWFPEEFGSPTWSYGSVRLWGCDGEIAVSLR